MGTVHWLEYPDPKPGYIVLLFSEGYTSAECHSIFEGFKLVIDSRKEGQLTDKETYRLVQDLKGFKFLHHEPFDFILINLWLKKDGYLEYFEFEICKPCISCNIIDRTVPHGYFSYEPKSPNDGKKKLKEKINHTIDSKDEGYYIVSVLSYFELISDFTEDVVRGVIMNSELLNHKSPPPMEQPSLN